MKRYGGANDPGSFLKFLDEIADINYKHKKYDTPVATPTQIADSLTKEMEDKAKYEFALIMIEQYRNYRNDQLKKESFEYYNKIIKKYEQL